MARRISGIKPWIELFVLSYTFIKYIVSLAKQINSRRRAILRGLRQVWFRVKDERIPLCFYLVTLVFGSLSLYFNQMSMRIFELRNLSGAQYAQNIAFGFFAVGVATFIAGLIESRQESRQRRIESLLKGPFR